MPFQKGNKLGRGRPPDVIRFYDVLHRAIKQDDAKRLRAIAEKMLDLAAAGEAWAAKEIADRLDGKAKQAVDVTVDPSDQWMETVAKAESLREKMRK
jgi:hypothetical protein